MMTGLPHKLQTLPQKPGVYLFKNSKGEVLYVGKAKNLKNRVRSYFGKKPALLPRTSLLRQEIADLAYIIVSNEIESLILENNLIKQYRPRFNVQLRDDKNYQFLKIDYGTEIPQIYPVRKIEKTGARAKYFGPYTSADGVKQTLRFIKNTFQLCNNKKPGRKPCFYYHLKRCPGVCIGQVSLENYRQTLREVEQFLNHHQGQIIKNLTKEMQRAAGAKRFETAAKLRDKIQGLRRIWEKQKIVSPKNFSADYFSLFPAKDSTVINLFVVREGKLIHQENFELWQPEQASDEQTLESFLKQYYGEASNLPQEIIIRLPLPDQKTIADWLKVKITTPRKGKKLELLKLGEENAEAYYQRNFVSGPALLTDLQNRLNLPQIPNRIEAFDVSNIQGFLPVGSMVVFEEGRPQKAAYRKFKIKHKQTPDDFAMMQEMLDRRFHRLQTQSSWPEPDLIVVDGGKGQLNAALEVLKKYRLAVPVIGLAKWLEEVFLPCRKEPLRLAEGSPTLFLLQRIRDEAHRFAITFYRSRHRKVQTRSRLDSIPGVGPVTKKKILAKFGTVSAIKSASLEALSQEVGAALAKKIREQL